MIGEEKPIAIFAAIAANLVIAGAKFFGAAMTGSSAMVSEGIHSLVDTGNGGLILFGQKRAARPADARHPFGHGKELYFWSLIVAVLIFALGGGMSIYEGVTHIRHPQRIEDPFWSYIVLGVAFVSEAISFRVALREFRKKQSGKNLWAAMRGSKDPSVFTILFEDAAALAGIVIAAIGIFLGHILENPYFDGGASVLIGALLCAVSLMLVRQSRGLLVGEAVAPETLAEIESIVRAEPAVIGVSEVLTMYLGAENILLLLRLKVAPEMSSRELVHLIAVLERSIQAKFPRVLRISVEPAMDLSAGVSD